LVLRRKLAKLHNVVPRGTTMQTAPSDVPVSPNRDPLLIDLALQGGGAHGAYTWGVLDRLLEEPWLRIDGISGTSAGAMNAAALVYGHSLRGVNRDITPPGYLSRGKSRE
jgi:predicted acylesterase/phospholipase RssA